MDVTRQIKNYQECLADHIQVYVTTCHIMSHQNMFYLNFFKTDIILIKNSKNLYLKNNFLFKNTAFLAISPVPRRDRNCD